MSRLTYKNSINAAAQGQHRHRLAGRDRPVDRHHHQQHQRLRRQRTQALKGARWSNISRFDSEISTAFMRRLQTGKEVQPQVFHDPPRRQTGFDAHNDDYTVASLQGPPDPSTNATPAIGQRTVLYDQGVAQILF